MKGKVLRPVYGSGYQGGKGRFDDEKERAGLGGLVWLEWGRGLGEKCVYGVKWG